MTKEQKAELLTQDVINSCKKLEVMPEETMEILALAMGNILTTIAPMFGTHPKRMLEIFGEGMMNAELTPKS